MPWTVPDLPDIDVACDVCGAADRLPPYRSERGNMTYPEPGDAEARGWDWSDVGAMCPDCSDRLRARSS
jgi:hypothetical protein